MPAEADIQLVANLSNFKYLDSRFRGKDAFLLQYDTVSSKEGKLLRDPH
jgi:hypothetical protein